MSFRLHSLPPCLRQSVFTRTGLASHTAPRWARYRHFSSQFFTRTAAPPPRIGRKLLWLIPVVGGFALYAAPEPRALWPSLFTSPTLIPCPPAPPSPLHQPGPIILSPSESDRSLLRRIISFLNYRIWEPILTARRFIFLCILFGPVILTAPMLLIGHPDPGLMGDRWGAVWWYGFLTRQMQLAGPTFIKLAQWAASRADLFPSLLCKKLGALHSRGKAHPLSHTKHVIEHVFQRPFKEVFEEFHEIPIGTGAIAQVYKAVLKQDLVPPSHAMPKRKGRAAALTPAMLSEQSPPVPTAAVAIKILHPHVDKLITRDLAIMSFFARVLSLLPGMQWLSLHDEVEVFGRMMHEQLDLRHEAENLAKFERNFESRKLPATFPRPLLMWSTKDVLIEEYQNALSLEDFLRNGAGPYSDLLAEVGLDVFLNMLLLDNFVHSDLHPGNIMIKFHPPPTSPQDAIASVLRKAHTSTEGESTPSQRSSDSVISQLRTLVNHPSGWRAAMDSLHTEGWQPEIVFVDAGLVTTLDGANRQNFLDLFQAVAEFDGYRAGMLMVERCRMPELAIDTETFALKMQHIVLNVKRKTFSLGQIKISDILTAVLRAVRQHHVKMEADFVNTVISILLLEGIGRQLDPHLDLFKSALPILRQLGRQMSTQENMTQINTGNMFTFFKVWVALEARGLASSAFVEIDRLVKYDWLTPNI